MKKGHVKLERALSKLGIASRTVARKWIEAGQVKVNGMIRKDPEFEVVPEKARIEVEGQTVQKQTHRTFLLYKTKGTVTTRSDEKGRPTVFDGIQEKGLHLIAVGRLDQATTGLLILTNDTRLADRLTDPKNKIKRVYLVTVRGDVSESTLAHLRKGIQDEGETLSPSRIEVRKASGKESHLTVELTEGKNREIRRMFMSQGHEVTKLKRVAYGNLTLGDLKPGEYRELTLDELASIT